MYRLQARRQEMKWGVFCKKVNLSPQNEIKLMLDLFFILHFTYLGVPTGLVWAGDKLVVHSAKTLSQIDKLTAEYQTVKFDNQRS